MSSFIFALTCGFYLLLAFIVGLNPRQVNIKANKWLALFLLSVTGAMFDAPLFDMKLYERYPHLIGFNIFFVLLIAPTLYFSITYFVKPTYIFQKKDYLHFLPTALLVVSWLPFYFKTGDEKLTDFKTNSTIAGTPNEILFEMTVLVIPLSVYWFLTYRKLTHHQHNVQLFASSTESIDLSWLRNFLWGIAVLVLILMNDVLKTFPIVIFISPILYAISAFYLTYFIIKQEEIFPKKSDEVLAIQEIIEENEQPLLERKQLLNDEQLAAMKAKLSHIMATEKPYLDSTLSLTKLAKMMTLSTHELSYIINAGFEDNFFVLSISIESKKASEF